jgi:glycosyltransferase involved in cell wall biosynthesis
MRRLRVCIDARVREGDGGIQQLVIGLARALSRLDDGNEEYLFLVSPGHDEWLRPHLEGRCRPLEPGHPPPRTGLGSRIAWQLESRVPSLRRRRWPPSTDGYSDEEIRTIGVSDATIEAAGVDVMHFALSGGFLTTLPSIYQPHDLQHVHHPHFFETEEAAARDLVHRAYCEQASLVVMMTSSGKREVVTHFGLPPEKVAVIPGGSVLPEYPEPSAADVSSVRQRLRLPERVVIYPARTWPHKNHRTLLEALVLLREEHGLELALVCPGTRDEHFAPLEKRISELGLSDSVRFPGFVSPLELRALYSLATALVFPSLSEGWGLPVTEAFESGVPVACSALPPLLDVAGDAALTFDPHSPEQIADSMARLCRDRDLRDDLVGKGKRRREQLSFDRAARGLRAQYRRLGGARLSPEDEELLRAPPVS